jgi:hypothetical protein
MKPMFLIALVIGAVSIAGCAGADPGTIKAVSGNYMVTISAMGRTDPDVLNIAQGTDGKLLFTFTAGITTDAMGPNADGLRVAFDGATLKLDAQPVHVDHSTGTIDGTVTGVGTLNRSGMVGLTLHLLPTNLALPADAGTPDGGASLDYEVTGTKE